jgi:LuxR family maltose regulon positive regulatory protein
VPLLTTKLYMPPPRPGLVSRSRLVQRLDEGLRLGHRLTLLAAPAGYGKTTLLSEWLSGSGGPQAATAAIAWLSLDEGDNDPIRFWQYLAAALQGVDPALGRTVSAVLSQPQLPPVEALATALLNDVAATSKPVILVLDDYHAITAGSVHRSLNFLLDHLQPPDRGLHLVVSTRADPPLSLSRRRGRAELTELRVPALRFTAEETAGFLNASMGLNLDDRDIAALADRTEGWAVGLQLAALALRQSPLAQHELVTAFAGDDRYVADYLVEEVLQRTAGTAVARTSGE